MSTGRRSFSKALILLLCSVLPAACARASSQTGPTPAKASPHQRPDTTSTALCLERRDGAIIQIDVNGSSLRFWSQNPDFIARAKKLQQSHEARTAMFSALIDGRDCDPQWTYHVDEVRMSWVDFSVEGCDGRPSDIEREKPYWLRSVGRYCPWSAKVVSVTDVEAPESADGGHQTPSIDVVNREAVRQQQEAVIVSHPSPAETQTVCAGTIPPGWIKVNDAWSPTSCGNPTSILYNVWTIERFDGYKVGHVMQACSGNSPAGWIVMNTAWSPTSCGHPTAIVQNVMTIKRLN